MLNIFQPIKNLFKAKAQVQKDPEASGYKSRSGNSFNGEKYSGGMNYPTSFGIDRHRLIQRSMKADVESMQARSAINRLNDSVINTGLSLESTPEQKVLGISDERRKEISDQIETSHNLWAQSKTCDKSGNNTLSQMERILFNNQLIKGDYFALLEYSNAKNLINPLQIRIIDPTRVCTPWGGDQARVAEKKGNKIVEGLEIDQNGSTVACYIKTKKPGHARIEWIRIPTFGPKTGRRMFIHGNRQRLGNEVRGIPILSTVAHELEKITDYSILELQAAIANAVVAMIVKPSDSAPANNPMPIESMVPNNIRQANGSWDATDSAGDLDNGYTNLGKNVMLNSGGLMVSSLNAGEDLVSHDTKRPNVNFPVFVDSVSKYLSASLNIPIEVLNMQFGSNFSASRASLKLFWQSINVWRSEIISDFRKPVYEAWMLGEVGTGRLILPGYEDPYKRAAWQSAKWNGVGSPSIDPVKEAKAAALRNKEGHSTRDQESKKYNGSEFSSNVKRLKRENESLGEANLPLDQLNSVAV